MLHPHISTVHSSYHHHVSTTHILPTIPPYTTIYSCDKINKNFRVHKYSCVFGATEKQKHCEQQKQREIYRMGNIVNDVEVVGNVVVANNDGGGFRKPRVMCLHGFRTSGKIMETQLKKWPETVLERMELVFPDAPFSCVGKSDVEGIFDPPYYEWFQFNKEFTDYENFDECLAYIEECMIKHGPIDGLLGFSQGAILSAALPGFQAKGLALTKVPKIKFLVIIGGAKLKNEAMAEKAYSPPIQCPSLHFLGEMDFLKPHGIELLESVVEPVVIHHPKGHTIPRLDEKGLEMMTSFLERIQKIVSSKED